jgi:hypothetical protein
MYRRSPQTILPQLENHDAKLSILELQLFLIGAWYHDFSALGVATCAMHPNQQSKQGPLFALIDQALSLCRDQSLPGRGVELFCSDGFYSNYAIQNGASEMQGVDLDPLYIAEARLISKVLGNTRQTRFSVANVFDLRDRFDFCICAGGLYHLSNPQELLRRLTGRVRCALVIQTVYSLEDKPDDYFETPAPGWTWGCRFSLPYLLRMVEDSGWTIVSSSADELGGNAELKDRGSAYLLCVHS